MLYAFGSNGAGQLGIGHTEDVSAPELVICADNPQATVKKIAAGGNHTLILYQDATVRASGNNEDGRIGLQEPCIFMRPELVILHEATSPIREFYDIAATWSASYFVAMDRRTIHVCGTGEHGELGLGSGVTAASQPRTIKFPDTIENIAACLSHAVVVLTNGEVWGWGQGRKGQLGEPNEEWWTPRRISKLSFPAVKALCGAYFTCILASNEDGRISVLGSSVRDRFGLRSGIPASVLGWTDAAAAWGSMFVLRGSELVAWGRNDRGQLPPPGIPSIKKIAAGSEHWLVLTTDSQVLSGGWGEHGNCGEPTDNRGVVHGRWNVVFSGKTVEHIFAGCATSFLEAF
ncbi:hypothetical protein AMS68_001210 [Peltaster fructicola]|uniref:RCC1-like domain-containing protein n=1 Tax=Peltaster fructicola TaxID=286661 RepID=A0A6H0XLU9_9PEZI|nr:hypothetical protein AMS68_001210 [Peltaster fructicola]